MPWDFTDTWQWTSFIMAGVALLLAVLGVPTVLRTFFGAPTIRTKFVIIDLKHLRALRCNILNPPIENRFLRLIGVRRESATVSGRFQVTEHGSDKIVVDNVFVILSTGGGSTTSIATVAPSKGSRAWFTIARLDTQDGSAILDCTEFEAEKQEVPLAPGGYKVTVRLDASGKIVKKTQGFVVDRLRKELRLT